MVQPEREPGTSEQPATHEASEDSVRRFVAFAGTAFRIAITSEKIRLPFAMECAERTTIHAVKQTSTISATAQRRFIIFVMGHPTFGFRPGRTSRAAEF